MSSARGRMDRTPVSACLALFALATALGPASGCGTSAPPKAPPPSPPLVEEAPPPEEAPAPKPPLSTEGLGFEPGSEVIRGDAAPAMEQLAASIGTEDAGPLVRVTVTVDPDPRLCSGVTLARSRAEALRDALIARGVPARRIAIEASTGSSKACHAIGATRASIRVAFIE